MAVVVLIYLYSLSPGGEKMQLCPWTIIISCAGLLAKTLITNLDQGQEGARAKHTDLVENTEILSREYRWVSVEKAKGS